MKLVAWISEALAALDARLERHKPVVSQSGLPVLLVHGIHSTSRDMARLAGHLRRLGRTVHLIDLSPSCGRAGIDELAGQIVAYVERQLPAGKFDLVGFSMGGLVSRYYVQRLGGAERVDHLVTLAAPHRGTILAIVNRTAGGTQMRRGSEFLLDLERDADRLARVKFTSIYTPLDLIILPASSSALPQARNVRLWASMHPSLILEKRCLRAVAGALAWEGEGEGEPEFRNQKPESNPNDECPNEELRDRAAPHSSIGSFRHSFWFRVSEFIIPAQRT